jgi:hypothetical protein
MIFQDLANAAAGTAQLKHPIGTGGKRSASI